MLLGSINNFTTLLCTDYTLNDIQVIKCQPISPNMKFVQSGMTELN